MTRAEIKLLARQLIQETLGSPTEGDPFAFDMFLNVVTDEIAARGDLYYTVPAAIDLTADESRYPIASLHHITAATVLSSTGIWRILTTIDPARMDRLYGGWWRNAMAVDTGDTTMAPVAYAVLEGTSTLHVWPTPSVTRANALQLEGFGAPGGSWSADTDTCPLPVWTHKVVAYSLAVERCVQAADAVSQARVQRLQARQQVLLAEMDRESGRFVQGVGKGKSTGPDGLPGPRAGVTASGAGLVGDGS